MGEAPGEEEKAEVGTEDSDEILKRIWVMCHL